MPAFQRSEGFFVFRACRRAGTAGSAPSEAAGRPIPSGARSAALLRRGKRPAKRNFLSPRQGQDEDVRGRIHCYSF